MLTGLDKNKFDKNGIHSITKTEYNERGFKADGLFYKFPNGEILEKGRRLDNHFFDIHGYYYEKNKEGKYQKVKNERHWFSNDEPIYLKTNPRGFNANGVNTITKTRIDRNKFDIDGYFYEKDKITGEYVKTKNKVDRGRFDCNGNNYDLEGKIRVDNYYNLNVYGFDFKTKKYHPVSSNGSFGIPKETDDYGFDYNGVNKQTGKIIDQNQFDRDGFYYMFDERDRRFYKVKPETKLNEYSFDRDGFIWENGKKTTKVRTKDGYDFEGFDTHKFDRKGINEFTGLSVNENGFNQQGYYCIRQEDGKYVATEEKYDNDGFNIDGFDKNGFSREHLTESGKKANNHNFRYDGINENTGTEWDEHGFNIKGIHKITGKKVDEHTFDIDGHYCIEQEDGSYISTEEIYDKEGYNIDGRNERNFDRDGYYNGEKDNFYDERGFKNDGTYMETGLRYNERLFDYKGINAITKFRLDVRGFNEEGYWSRSRFKERYDAKGFDANGINKHTNTEFDSEGYNCYGVDKNGKGRDGNIHIYISNTRRYIEDTVLKGVSIQNWCKANKLSETQLRKELFMASEMFPAIKEEVCVLCNKLKEQIIENEKKNTREAMIKNMPLKQKVKKAEKIFEIE